MSLAEYVPTAWTDYADSPDLEALFLNHIELGIEAVTDELIAFEAWADLHYQPVSAELTAIAGLSSPGYVRRTGPGTYVTVASIPQADVAGGPFLPLVAGAANALTGPLYSGGTLSSITPAPLNLVNGAAGAMKTQLNLVNTAGLTGAGSAIDFFTYDQGAIPGVRIGAVDDNWSASFSIWTKVPGAAGNPLVERLKISNSGVVTLSSLGAGFVRANSSGLLSSSALVAGDLPGTIASDTTGSAARWTTARTLTIGATGKAVDGSTNVSWSLAEIGAAPAFTSGAAGFVWATPAATAGVPSLRALVASDIPSLDASKVTTGTFADARIASATTWNAKLGTVTADATSRAANTFYAAPNGAAGAATFRAIVAADIPTLNQNTTGSAAKWSIARSISMTGDVSWTVSVDGSANATATGTLVSIITAGGPIGSASVVPVVTWDAKGRLTAVSSATITPAAIGALAAGGTAVNSSALGGVGSDYFVQGNGGGALGHRTTQVSLFNTPSQSGFYDASTATDGPQGAVWTHMVRSAHTGNATTNQWMFDIAAPFTGGSGLGSEGYYVRTIASGVVGTWRQLWHSGNLTSGTLPGGPYVPLAGNVTVSGGLNVGPYSNTGAALSTGDAQYGISGYGGALWLWSAPGGQVISTRNFSSQGAISAATTLSWGGGWFQNLYGDTNYTAIYGSGVTPGNSPPNYSLAVAKSGAYTYISGTTSSHLAVGGAAIATANSVGLNITPFGTFRGLVQDSSVPAFYAKNVTPSSGTTYNYGLAFSPDGADAYLNGTAASNLAVNGAYVARATAGLLTVSGNMSVTGAATLSAGFTVPQSAVASFGTSEIHREASYMGLWGKGVPWQFGRGYTVYTSPNNVTATFNEGIDCLGGVWTDSLFVRTEFYPSSTKWSSTSNYTLPVMAPGEQRVIFINATACSVYANGSQTVNYRSFSTGDMRQAAFNARVDSAGSFGYGSTTTVHSFLLICLDSSRVTLIC